MTTTQITITPRSTNRPITFTVRRDDADTIVLTNSRGEDTGYIFTNLSVMGDVVVGACARRWTGNECREAGRLAIATVGE